ncbi:hypothetical protein [Roseiarcus sp.]|uniref:hypothetical protein n=1 Tax=Roseiarcus sp. TaxID=1969460 RepID=UPI003F960C06
MGRARTYSVHCTGDCYWIVDDDVELIACNHLDAARLIAALMNGDLCAVANVSDGAVTDCRRTLTDALQPLKGFGRPALEAAFPEL